MTAAAFHVSAQINCDARPPTPTHRLAHARYLHHTHAPTCHALCELTIVRARCVATGILLGWR